MKNTLSLALLPALFSALLSVATLSACDKVKAAVNLLPKEQACVDSERWKTSDAKIKVVANLGDRGLPLKREAFWVRFQVESASGPSPKRNMLCEKINGKWVRAENDEFLIRMRLASALLAQKGAALRAREPRDSFLRRLPNPRGDGGSDVAFELAGDVMFKEDGRLAK